jgi:hypothetical protein
LAWTAARRTTATTRRPCERRYNVRGDGVSTQPAESEKGGKNAERYQKDCQKKKGLTQS